MLQCLGCESVKLQSLWSSNGCDEVESSYPPPTFRRPPKWLFQWRMQFGLQEAYEVGLFQEIYTALQNAQPRLAAMGDIYPAGRPGIANGPKELILKKIERCVDPEVAFLSVLVDDEDD
jgi:hypothetical protein